MKKKHKGTTGNIKNNPPEKKRELPINETIIPGAGEQRLFKRIFYASLLLMLVSFFIAGYDTGVCYDELTQNVYAKENINFYKSGGKDTSCFSPVFKDSDGAGALHSAIKYYTCLFDYAGIAVNTLFGNMNGYEYNTRHVLVQLISVLGLFFTGRMALLLTGRYRVAVIAIWLLFLTPLYFGMSLMNPKDIPFLAGYVASLYFFAIFLQQMPRPTWKVAIWLMIALFCTFGVRIGGVMIFLHFACTTCVYYLVYRKKLPQLFRDIRYWFPKILVAILGALTLIVLSWPYVLVDPIVRLKEAILVAAKFPQKIPVVFEGVITTSLELPPGYLPRMMFISIPALVIIGFVVSIVLMLLNRKRYKFFLVFLLLFSSFFPLVYAELSHSSMYNGWRHFLFTYPGIVIFTATGINMLWEKVKKYQFVFVMLLIAGMSSPLLWILRTTPYQYTYFNEFSGGFANVFHDYEKDYWFISVKEAIDWLVENEIQPDNKDTVIVATNSVAYTHYYFKRRHPDLKVKVVETGIKGRNFVDWDYAMLGNFFLHPYLEELYFPPPLTIHTVDIDGMPVNAIVRDKRRYDRAAIYALAQNDFQRSDSLFDLHLQHIGYKGNHLDLGGIGGQIAYAKMAVNKMDEALRMSEHTLHFDSDNYLGNLVAGIVYFNRGNATEARRYLQHARNVNPQDVTAIQYLQQMRGG